MDTKTLKQRIIFRRLIQGLVILVIFLMGITQINQENDIFWQLKMGEQIWNTHTFPTADPYNLSNPGAVWTLEEWLPATSFYVIFKYIGSWGLVIYKSVIIATTFTLFMVLFNRLKVNLYLSLIVLLLAAMVNTRGIWTVFPSIFEYLFIVITLLVLEYYQTHRKKIIIIFLVVFSFLWPQVHASFFLFTGILTAYLVGDIVSVYLHHKYPQYRPSGGFLIREQRKYLSVIVLISIVTPFLTPNGYWTWIYPLRITFGKFTFYVSEYQKFWTIWNWNFSDFVHGFTLILMGIIVIIFVLDRLRVHIRDIILAGVFIALALTAVRHVAVFALVALFLIARYLPVWFGEYRGIFKRSIIKDVLVCILILFFIVYYKTNIAHFNLDFSEDGYPKEAAEFIMNNKISGNMFNHYNYGGYLIWKMSPKYKVFIDGRLEMYEGEAGQDYLAILAGKDNYQQLLEKYNINFFLSYLSDPIAEKLVDDPHWRYVYHDVQYVVFVKNSPQNSAFFTKYWSEDKQQEFKKSYKLAVAYYWASSYNGDGIKAWDKKEYIKAMELFQQATALDPTLVDVKRNLARSYMVLGHLYEARATYQSVLEINPNDVVALKGLDYIKKMLKD